VTVTAPGSWRGLNVRPRYTERHVEILLPLALWGIEPERPAPIPEYRKGGDGRSSDMPAMLADMQQAWNCCSMGHAAKRALFLRLAGGLQQHQVAAHEGVTERTAYARERAAVLAILDYLNGEHRG